MLSIFEIDSDVYENPLIKMHLWILRYYGLVIVKNKDNFHHWWYFFRTILITGYIFLAIAIIFVRVAEGYGNFADGSMTCATGVLGATTGLVIANAHLSRQRLVKLVKCAHEEITTILANGDELELALYQKTKRYLRIVSILLFILMMGGCILAILDSIVRMIFAPNTVFNLPEVLNGSVRPIILFQILPFPEIVHHFWLGYCLAIAIIFIGCLYISIWHTFVTCLFEIAILKQRIVNQRVKDMNFTKINFDLKCVEDIKNLSESELNHWRRKMLEFCAKEQLKTRRFLMDIQELIKWPVFIDFVLSSVSICFQLYYLTTSTLNQLQYLFSIFFTFGAIMKLLLYHWHCDKVKDVTEDLQVALYSCDWYNFPVEIQKLVFTMILSTTKPLIITAIMVELNLKTFLSVVRGAYSFLNLLRGSKKY